MVFPLQRIDDNDDVQAAGAQKSSVCVQTSQETTPRPVDQARGLAKISCTSSYHHRRAELA
jgi:hypothetical protein